MLTFGGEIDCSNVAEIGAGLRAKVLRAPPSARVVMDCSELTFIDSLGLELMARLQQLADERDLLLTWRDLSAHVRNLVCLLSLDRLIKMEPPDERRRG